MAIHVCHGVTFVCLLIAFALGAASLGLSFVHLKGTAAPSALKPFVAVTSELYPFKRCTDTTGNAAIYTTSNCPSWDDYWSVDTSYCPTIGSTGSITTKEMLTKVNRAGVTGGLYVAGVFIHLILFLLWAVSLIPTRFVLVPTVLICIICWCVCLAMWGEMYNACDSNYCDAAQARARTAYGLTSTECWLADGVRTAIASFIIYMGCLVPVAVFSPPTAEVAPEETKPADGAVAEKSHEPV